MSGKGWNSVYETHQPWAWSPIGSDKTPRHSCSAKTSIQCNIIVHRYKDPEILMVD
jgi:hypothetical protein